MTKQDKRCSTCSWYITDRKYIHACAWVPPLPWPYWREAGGAKPVDPNAKDCPAWVAKEPKS